MKVIAAAFLLLAAALVDAAPAGSHSRRQEHLRQIIDSANKLLKDNKHLPATKELLNTFVSSGFNKIACECKDLRMATKILAPPLKPTNYTLARALHVYTKHYESKSDLTSLSHEQYQLRELVTDVLHCAQLHMHANHSHCPWPTPTH